MISSQSDLIAWCQDRRAEAEQALALFESGKMRFFTNGVDATPFQKANLADIIANLDEIISRTPDG